MNTYKLSKEEIEKAHNEFNKTDFGRRAKTFSMMPIILSYISFFVAFIIIIINTISDFISVEEVFANSELLIFLIFGVSVILLSLGCVAQLQYGKMLNDYINSNSKK